MGVRRHEDELELGLMSPQRLLRRLHVIVIGSSKTLRAFVILPVKQRLIQIALFAWPSHSFPSVLLGLHTLAIAFVFA